MRQSYSEIIWEQFKKNRIGVIALIIVSIYGFLGLYAPLFASSKPLLVSYEGTPYFPLFRYLFYPGFYTKPIDLFYNVLMFIFPLTLLGFFLFRKRWRKPFLLTMITLQIALFVLFESGVVKDPQSTRALTAQKQEQFTHKNTYREDPLLSPITTYPTWSFEEENMSPYAKLNLLLRYKQRLSQHERLLAYGKHAPTEIHTLWQVEQSNVVSEKERYQEIIHTTKEKYEHALERLPELTAAYRPYSHDFLTARYDLERAQKAKNPALLKQAQDRFDTILKETSSARIPLEKTRATIQKYRDASAKYALLEQRQLWLASESPKLKILLPAFMRPFHWEDDAGGGQSINKYVPWWETTRINRKDLVAALIFGVRISLVVGFTAVLLSLLIGIPLGMISGYFAGKTDMIVCRFIEVWEAMPTFFMLLLIVAITQSKSIFLVVAVLGIFGWTGFGRFIRGEVLKQRNLPYVLACHSLGFNHRRIMFSHILPNAIPPILTLLPFSMMAAITSEAGLSFLGLGEEGSTSWGVLMDEGRSVFPGESYLLWPPAILLTLLLICIALVGDTLRDAIDPKLRR